MYSHWAATEDRQIRCDCLKQPVAPHTTPPPNMLATARECKLSVGIPEFNGDAFVKHELAHSHLNLRSDSLTREFVKLVDDVSTIQSV